VLGKVAPVKDALWKQPRMSKSVSELPMASNCAGAGTVRVAAEAIAAAVNRWDHLNGEASSRYV